MGKTTEAFTIPEGSFECPVVELHAAYLGREVMAVDPKTGLRIVGELKSMKFGPVKKASDLPDEKVMVTLKVSGFKLRVPGSFKLVFVDGGQESLP